MERAYVSAFNLFRLSNSIVNQRREKVQFDSLKYTSNLTRILNHKTRYDDFSNY